MVTDHEIVPHNVSTVLLIKGHGVLNHLSHLARLCRRLWSPVEFWDVVVPSDTGQVYSPDVFVADHSLDASWCVITGFPDTGKGGFRK